MKAVKTLSILLLAIFGYSAVSAQMVHHRWHKRHHIVHQHRQKT
ncbi:MAG: hypothetical protein JWP94_2908 [Mucilaginibacter sp.]|nr:hypothetical protein [Mucilaginibacter sp.]